METKDLYKVLGLSKEASQEDIRKAHRKLVRQKHPDANPEDPQAEERFKKIQQAYEVLSNPEKRREYDERFHTPSRKDISRPHVGTGGRAGEGTTTYTSSERVRRNRGPLFWLGYLLGIALVALVVVLLITLILALD